MQNNYYATAYPVKAVLDIWVRNDESHGWEKGTQTQVRRIVIVNSAAAFVGISGLIGYTSKCLRPENLGCLSQPNGA